MIFLSTTTTKKTPKDGFQSINYPDSFRACLSKCFENKINWSDLYDQKAKSDLQKDLIVEFKKKITSLKDLAAKTTGLRICDKGITLQKAGRDCQRRTCMLRRTWDDSRNCKPAWTNSDLQSNKQPNYRSQKVSPETTKTIPSIKCLLQKMQEYR